MQSRHLFSYYSFPIVGIILVGVLSVYAPDLLSSRSVSITLASASISGLMFLGATFVFAIGEIELSFVGIAVMCNMICAGLLAAGADLLVSLVLGFGVGLLAGCINGWLVGYMRLPSLIITIATGGIAVAVANAIGEGSSIALHINDDIYEVVTAQWFALPVIFLATIILYCIFLYAQQVLIFGHTVYAIEENRQAAEERGIPAPAYIFSTFVLAAASAAAAGLLLTITLNSGQPTLEGSYFIDGLTVILLGGVAFRLGHPNVAGTAIGIVLFAFLNTAATQLGWRPLTMNVVKGVVLIGSVALTYAISVRRRDLGLTW